MNIESLASQVGLSVRSVSRSEEETILDLPRAQRRTASFKKAVFVGGDSVYKGPYLGSDSKLRNNLLHTALVALLERWLGVSVCTVRAFRELLKSPKGEYYLVAENLGEASPQDYEVVTTKVEENVKVLRRGSFLSRLSELEEQPLLLPDSVWSSCLQHLYVLYVLGIGDHGPHNVLLTREKQVVGIDLEELRSERSPTSRLDALFKKASARQRQLYARYLSRISIFSPLEAWQEGELSAYNLSQDEIEDIQDRIAAFLLMREA